MAAEPEEQVVDADVVPDDAPEAAASPTQAVAVIDRGQRVASAYGGVATIVHAEDPKEIIAHATKIADALRDLIEAQGLAADMGGGKKHVEVGGWQALGALLGALGGVPLHAETVPGTCKPIVDPATGQVILRDYVAKQTSYYPKNKGGGIRQVIEIPVQGYDWEACVEIKTPDDLVVGRAEGMVSRAEPKWMRADDYAVRSMAETRAESRAWRRAAGWIVRLAGYKETPKEEMPDPEAPELPDWAKEASERALASLARALGYFLGDRPDGHRVAGLMATIASDAGGPVPPSIAARAILHLAHTHRQLAEAAQQPSEPDPEPAQADGPDAPGGQHDMDEARAEAA